MATVKAVIRKSKVNKHGECVIYVRYTHREKWADFSTGIKVKPEFWSPQKQTINSSRALSKNKTNQELIIERTKNDRKANSQVALKKEEILGLVRSLQLEDSEPYADEVKRKYSQKEEVKESIEELNNALIIPLFSAFIDNSSKSRTTTQSYKTCRHHLKSFEIAYKRKLKVKDMTIEFYKKYLNFLSREYVNALGDRGLQDSTSGASVKNLKVLLRHLKRSGYPIPAEISELKVNKVTPPIIYLIENEVRALVDLDLENNKRLEKVRDLFVFNCYCGLRYSDLSRLSPYHFKDDELCLRTHKNMSDVEIPLMPLPLQIAKKYNFLLPKISEQKFNTYLKEVGKLAELTDMVEQVSIKSGNKEFTMVSKWSVLSSHIAIKTFITLCGEKGVSPKTVSEITGKSVSIIIKHYYGTSKSTIRNEMNRAFG
ncbi:MAG: phage integrase SAM-like domain-containing protein [Ekhidna sp.]|nr:phage integrase SAM-like domain-containing protein [Ekhidna sp.]